MSDWSAQMWWNVLVGGTNALTLLALVLLILRHRKSTASTTDYTATATHCGHCGQRVKQDPDRAISVADKVYFVYRCRSCKQETLLPTSNP